MDVLKYKNKYRIASARHQHWDYGWNAAYFITICTAHRQHYFGEITDGKMQLSQVGVIADILWHEIVHHARHIELDAFVVMPNHIHGILILNNDDEVDVNTDVNQIGNVETRHALSLPVQPVQPIQPLSIGQQRFQNQGQNTISSIIGGYKSAVTNHAHRLGFKYAWQTRFHDHIIRDYNSFNYIANYIENNPTNWKEDRFFHE